MNISNDTKIYWLEKLERVSVLSTFTSLYAIGVKILYRNEKKSPPLEYLKSKSWIQLTVLCLPVIGNIAIKLFDLFTKKASLEKTPDSISTDSTLPQEFNNYTLIQKKKYYQEANESHKVNLVRQMNALGMKPSVPPFSGPSIVSHFMDIATKYEIILGYLKDLRKSNRLLTEKEFEPLSTKNWIKKEKLNRLLGCDHLMQKIQENQFKHMKVPLKIAVIQTTQSFNITGWQTSELYDIYTPEITVYAEKIRQVDRKLSREEIDELIQLIAKAHFLDLWPQNIVVAKEGVYFIDTEFKSFDGSIQWEKMVRFQSLIKEEDRGYFNEKVEAQEKEYKIKEIYSFKSLKAILRKRKLESYPGEMKKFEEDVLNLKYVGAEKAGNDWISPNRFTFHLNEILS